MSGRVIMSFLKDFPILDKYHYLDSASTTIKPKQVVEKMSEYYLDYGVNVHRGLYDLSEIATEEFEQTRDYVSKFFGAKREGTIFTSGTTQGLNIISSSLSSILPKKSNVLISEMEHNSNIVPWIMKNDVLNINFIPLKGTELDYEKLEQLFREKKPKVVSVVHGSNVLGTINDIKRISQMCLEIDAILIVDAAQSAPHMKIDYKKMGADFIVFSAHKMLGGTGLGVILGDVDLLEKMPSGMGGGNMLSDIDKSSFKCAELPNKFEAGTSNIASVIGFKESLKYVDGIGFEQIESTTNKLLSYSLDLAKNYPKLEVISNTDCKNNLGVFSFKIEGVHSHDLSDFLNKNKVCVRSGMHCAHILHKELGLLGSTRASFYFYNTLEDIDALFDSIDKIYNIFN